MKKNGRKKIMSEDKIIYKIDWHYGIEKMSGKEGTYIIRKRNGLIAAFIEKQGDNITNFTPHQNRRLPKRIINKVAEHIIKQKYTLSKDSARALGVSLIKSERGDIQYISSSELKRRGLEFFQKPEEIEQITIYNLYKQDIKIAADSHNKFYDLQQANIKKLRIGEDVQAEIDLRDNGLIEEVVIEENFNGKLYLAQSNIRKLEIKDNCHGEINYTTGTNRLKIDIGNSFGGHIFLKSAYLEYLRIGDGCSADIKIELCIFYKEIRLGKENTSEIVCSSVYAKYFELGDYFSGHLKGLSQSSKQGVRELYVGHHFSGYIDLSGSNTIERIELGAQGDGKIDLIGCKSIRIIRIDSEFSGELNLMESDIVYIRAEAPCFGDIDVTDATKITRVILPKKREYKIKGAVKKPIKAKKKGKLVEYYIRRIRLPNGYFISTAPRGIITKIKRWIF